MVKILQYGEGNFLRAFADAYFDTLNREQGGYQVYAVKPRPGGSVETFRRQGCRYHVILRGISDGQAVEQARQIDVLQDVIHPFEDEDAYYALASDPELKLIVSNTTEAGICFCADDRPEDIPHCTFPARLTLFLHRRFAAGCAGVYLLPTELIDRNGEALFTCVDRYISLWQLGEDFRRWNRESCFYCDTLVDRIVSGYPKDPETLAHLEALLGGPDPLMTVAEPFGLWVIQNKGALAQLLPTGRHDIDVVLTDNVSAYKERKVRLLNGSHTNLVAAGLLMGVKTVAQCMAHDALSAFMDRTLKQELLPFVPGGAGFAEDVMLRFRNPYLHHQLGGIALNSISKWRARLLPTFRDYFARFGRIPPHITVGFSCLMALYHSSEVENGCYYAPLPGGRLQLQDDPKYLARLAGGSIPAFLADSTVWGEDLTAYPGFCDTVCANVEALARGETLL